METITIVLLLLIWILIFNVLAKIKQLELKLHQLTTNILVKIELLKQEQLKLHQPILNVQSKIMQLILQLLKHLLLKLHIHVKLMKILPMIHQHVLVGNNIPKLEKLLRLLLHNLPLLLLQLKIFDLKIFDLKIFDLFVNKMLRILSQLKIVVKSTMKIIQIAVVKTELAIPTLLM